MTPAQIAKQLIALDWSNVSTQHQLAVGAAVETLVQLEPVVQEAAVARVDMPADRMAVVLSPAERIETNVIPLPVKPRTRWTSLHHLDGTRFASSSGFTDGGAWNWILDTVSAEHGVHVDQIGCTESDETQPYDCDDLVTVDGLPVYRIRHTGALSN